MSPWPSSGALGPRVAWTGAVVVAWTGHFIHILSPGGTLPMLLWVLTPVLLGTSFYPHFMDEEPNYQM